MDHEQAVRQNATERYLLDELDPEQRDQFEEHFFDCQDCAKDVRAAATLIEQIKEIGPQAWEIQARQTQAIPVPFPDHAPMVAKAPFHWLSPALAAPVFAALLLVVGYQNLVQLPNLKAVLNQPHFLPYASLNIPMRGDTTRVIAVQKGEDFILSLNTDPNHKYASYVMDLSKADGTKEWSLAVAPESSTELSDDAWQIQVPGAHLTPGDYAVVVRGVSSSGESTEIGQAKFELRLRK
jgi:hypothetical protein